MPSTFLNRLYKSFPSNVYRSDMMLAMLQRPKPCQTASLKASSTESNKVLATLPRQRLSYRTYAGISSAVLRSWMTCIQQLTPFKGKRICWLSVRHTYRGIGRNAQQWKRISKTLVNDLGGCGRYLCALVTLVIGSIPASRTASSTSL